MVNGAKRDREFVADYEDVVRLNQALLVSLGLTVFENGMGTNLTTLK